MERMIDFVIERLPDTKRFQLAKKIEICKIDQNEEAMAFFGFDISGLNYDDIVNEIPDRIDPNQIGCFISDLYLTELPVNSYQTLISNLIPMAFGTNGEKLSIHPRLRTLGKMLNLSKDELVYIMFAYCVSHDDNFARLCAWDESARVIRDAALVLKTKANALRKMFHQDSPLIRYGIINSEPGRSALKLDLADSVDDFLSGYTDTPYSADLEPLPAPRFPLETFPVSIDETNMLVSLLQSEEPYHILMFGASGTGKTEFMKALIGKSGRKAMLLRFNERMMSSQGRIVSLSTVSRILAPSKVILIIDECDSILNTDQHFSFMGKTNSNHEQFGKEWLNLFLDETKLSTIWITNNTTGIHDSVKRRFTSSIYFEATPLEHRKRIWLSLAQEYDMHDFASDPKALRLINAYLPSPANMEAALKLLKKMAPNDPFSKLELTLNAQRTLKQGSVNKPKFEELTDAYDPDAVNAGVKPSELIESIRLAYARQDNLCLLFHGSSGTGKTELAKFLSRECGRNLLVKRASDLLNPFVGMTESLIARMFREAERDGSILLFDEADSLLRDRSKARQSWEITQTNEILTQMENFKGIMIACTNLISVMDKAVLRRFSWKIHFLPLNKDQRIRLFKRWFPLAMLDQWSASKLDELTILSPGDFKAVARRTLSDKLSHTLYLLEELKSEASFRESDSRPKQKPGFRV